MSLPGLPEKFEARELEIGDNPRRESPYWMGGGS
jgi:hypothetical protein